VDNNVDSSVGKTSLRRLVRAHVAKDRNASHGYPAPTSRLFHVKLSTDFRQRPKCGMRPRLR